MCRPWWTPARLHQIACNQKYCAATKTRSSEDVDMLSHVKREKNTKGVYFDQYLSDCEQLYCLWVKISKNGPKFCQSVSSIGFHKKCDPTQMSMFPLNCIILSFHQQCGAKLYWEDQEQICFLSKMMKESHSSESIALNVAADRQLKLDNYNWLIGQIHFASWTNTFCKLYKYMSLQWRTASFQDGGCDGRRLRAKRPGICFTQRHIRAANRLLPTLLLNLSFNENSVNLKLFKIGDYWHILSTTMLASHWLKVSIL